MIKRLLLICSLLVGNQYFAQLSVNGGTSLFNNFGIGANYYGFDLGMEYSDSDDQSYWGRISIYPGKRNKRVDTTYLENFDPTQNFYPLGFKTKTSYTQFAGGSRYYIGDGYEYGLAAYGGYKFSLIMGTVKFEFDEYDQNTYKDPTDVPRKSQLLFFTLGLNGGVKYSFGSVGTVYFDASVDYGILGSASNNGYYNSDYFNGSSLFFSLNLGFRKDLNWY